MITGYDRLFMTLSLKMMDNEKVLRNLWLHVFIYYKAELLF